MPTAPLASLLPRAVPAIADVGLALCARLPARPDDRLAPLADGRPIATLLIVGWRGRRGWDAFAASPEAGDDRPDPLDRWSRRVIDALAARLGGRALYPFDGPPWRPFQAWAARGGRSFPSPLGLTIDPDVGLWQSFRGALALAEPLDEPIVAGVSPCDACRDRPCLTACPVAAFDGATYAVARCRAHLEDPMGASCRDDGCRARRACPVGRDHVYAPAQIRFLMRAFRAAPPFEDPT
ncbi:ferredoxin [Siculibacillus lacustris]|uniref:Ferredoxin n=1 Tax=Siculibacillus lacustris TaxID=1549641 RepID=A0A4Q9VW92_9HYPH|nr:ferredoxin [Siculibacillus lacustris]TBW40103.1 ferredoxin [Siculibacillus lacustris]